jgi:hypothetical protein
VRCFGTTCETMIRRFPNGRLSLANFKSALAESHFQLGDRRVRRTLPMRQRQKIQEMLRSRRMTPPSSSVPLFCFAFSAVRDRRGALPALLAAAFRFGAAGVRRNRVSDRMTSSSIDGAPSFKSPDIHRSSSRIGSLSGAPRARRSSSRMVLSFFGPIKGVPPKAS